NAACVVALVDRLVHHAEIVGIKGQSYRHKEAQERARARTAKRKPSKEAA
ncbi:ATP-binding protein, partial [Hydrogenophaga sp.]